ncbi:MAG: ABC transporter ATP-binding protein [Clostridia bacterium]|nr:ABC transporter ATP-binding protein [Clostridia bacterium]
MKERRSPIKSASINEKSLLDSFRRHRGSPFVMLISFYKSCWAKLVGSAACFVIKHTYVWVLPVATAAIINAITEKDPKTPQIILANALFLIFLGITNIPFNHLYTHFNSSSVRAVEAGLRSALVRKLQILSIAFHNRMQSGRLQSKIMRDVESVEALSRQVFESVVSIALNLVVSFAVTLSRSWIVFIFFLLTVPVAALLVVAFRKRIGSRNMEFRVAMEEASGAVMEMVELVPVTRAHALEEWEIDRMKTQLVEVASKGYRLDLIQSFFGSLSWVSFQFFQLFCLIFTGILAMKGKISVGDVVLYQTYFTTIVNQVSTLITLLPSISKGLESVTSIGDVLLSDDIEENEGKKKLSCVRGEITFENVSFSYNSSREILRGLDLQVRPGETVAFVGGSGAGKTTILNLIIGFYKATSGRVLVDGEDIRDLDMRSFREQLAVVPQNSVLFSGTIRDNITYGLPGITDAQLAAAVEAANLTEMIAAMPEGLETRISEHGANLSGGQRQRISIARAIIRDPSIIVLDEATSALDSISEKKIQEAIGNLVRGRTTFIVAHRLSTIRNADRIAVISEGRCVEIGSYEELMEKKGAFYALKKLQS